MQDTNTLSKRDPNLDAENFWYELSHIKKIIKAAKISKDEEVDLGVAALSQPDVALYSNKELGIVLEHDEHFAKTVCINIVPSLNEPVSANDLRVGINNTVNHLLNQKNAAPLPRTFIFQAHVGGNHWATYACRVDANNNGEIMIINSKGNYKEWDDAAIEGFRQAFNKKGVKVTEPPIEMTPRQDRKFAQKDGSACGPITAAMSCEIDSSRSFAAQKTELETEMENICKGDADGSYETLREKHRNLVGLVNGIEGNADKKPTAAQKEAIIKEVAKPNYPNALPVDDKPDAPKDDSDSSSSQKSQQKQSQVQQNGKKIPPAVVEDCLGKICRQEGLSFIGDNGQYVVGDQGKKIHVEVGKDGKLSASTDDSEMLEKMIKMFAEKMDKLGEKPRELILKGDPQAVQIMEGACAKYNITVVDPNSQQNKKPDPSQDTKKQPEKPKESKLKIPAPEPENSLRIK